MAGRVAKRADKFVFSGPEEVEAHIRSLVGLATVANRIMSSMVHLELSIRFFVKELEAGRLDAMATDLNRTKELLTQVEVARKLGVSVVTLRKDRSGLFPKPIRGVGRSVRYRSTDVHDWLVKLHGANPAKEA